MKQKSLLPGMRVRLHAPPLTVRLTKDTGVIDREWNGYFIVRLDEPAAYERGDGEIEHLSEIREAADNLTVIDIPETVHHRA